jgi:hypothetical protein
LALESEDIASVVQNEPGGALPFIPSSILVEDADYDRAVPIVQELEPRDRGVQPFAVYKRTWRMTLILLIIVVALLSIQWLLSN